MSLSLKENQLNRYNYNKIFIETGTFMGGGVYRALDAGFEKIHSIEISYNFFKHCYDIFSGYENVTIHLGDSVEILPQILEKINEPVTFFLDGHFFSASPSVVDNKKLGIKDVPLLLELDVISKHHIKNHTILIDDRRAFGYAKIFGDIVDWSEIVESEVEKKLLEINPDYKFHYLDTSNAENDILVAEVRR